MINCMNGSRDVIWKISAHVRWDEGVIYEQIYIKICPMSTSLRIGATFVRMIFVFRFANFR